MITSSLKPFHSTDPITKESPFFENPLGMPSSVTPFITVALTTPSLDVLTLTKHAQPYAKYMMVYVALIQVVLL
jgi:hypothetical protein